MSPYNLAYSQQKAPTRLLTKDNGFDNLISHIQKKESEETIMPNWVRGSFVVRGTKVNIIRFLLNNLKADVIEIFEEDWQISIVSQESIYIEGTSCDFIANDIEFNFATEDLIKQCTMHDFMAANSIKPEPYILMSKKYGIDIDVCGVEIYGGFTQEIEIRKGEIVKYKVEEINLGFRAEEDDFIELAFSSANENLSSDDRGPYSIIDDLPF